MKLEYAQAYGIPPETVGAVSLLWWERHQAWELAKNSRQAVQLLKSYKNITDAPRSVLMLADWARDKGENVE